jgi:peptidoglycan hydrolase-like protein with peptidoglycan-binding domain/uncharacterized protein YecT (DUF1311 family)
MKRLATAVTLMLLACPAMAAVLLTATVGSGRAIGPSFDCASEQTPLTQFICASPDLSRADLESAQAYYALRQQVGPAGWQALKQEDIDFHHRAKAQCGVAPSGALPPDGAALSACLRQGYVAERSLWLARLSGAAREEASRPVEQHVALQRDLQALGFLPPTATIDGVYGAATRTGISAWQHANNQPDTGFISNTDAGLLMNTGRSTKAVAAPSPSESQPSAAFRQGQVDRQGWEAWSGTLTGDYRAGAEYWAGHRSLPNPGSCSASPPSTGADWTAGCFAAQQKLAGADVRRKTESDYRLGWNSPPSVAAAQAPPPSPPPSVAPAAPLAAHDRIERSWLGVRVQEVTPEIAESLGLPKAEGALVASLNPGGLAEKIGIKQGDVIEAFGGHDIIKMRDLPPAVAETYVGQQANVKLWRDGQELMLAPTIVAMPNNLETPPSLAPSTQAPIRALPPASAQAPTTDVVIAEWKGYGSTTTRPFHADGAWELQWDATAMYGAALFSATSHVEGKANGYDKLLANTGGDTSQPVIHGTAYHQQGGDYYLSIQSLGEWHVRVVSISGSLRTDNAATRSMGSATTPAQIPLPAESGVRAVPPTIQAPALRSSSEMPNDEAYVVQIVNEAISQYKSGQNDMQKGASRPTRARAICAVLPNVRANNWIGTVNKLSTNGEGKGVLYLQIAPNIYVMTWNNALSDISDETLIDPQTNLFRTVSQLHEGQKVRFSGRFPASDTDCIKESSLTLGGSITEPNFIIKFESVAANE